MAEDKTTPAAKADDVTTEEAPSPSETAETNEQAFADAFEEFAGQDDTETVAAPDPGPEKDDKPQAGAAAPAATDDPAASGKKPSDDVTDAAAPEGAAETPDIWADATPEQKAAFEAVQHENVSHRGRSSILDRREAALKAAPPAAKPAAETPATPETDEDWEKFKTEYPEVAGPMEQRFENRMSKLEAENTDLRGQVTGITDAQVQVAINTEEAVLLDRHPDWEALTVRPDFLAWLPTQPRYVQEGLARNGTEIVDGQEAASLIDLFKDNAPAPTAEAKPETKDTATSGKVTRRQRRLVSAVTTEGGQAGPGAGPPEGDFDAAFEHFAALP